MLIIFLPLIVGRPLSHTPSTSPCLLHAAAAPCGLWWFNHISNNAGPSRTRLDAVARGGGRIGGPRPAKGTLALAGRQLQVGCIHMGGGQHDDGSDRPRRTTAAMAVDTVCWVFWAGNGRLCVRISLLRSCVRAFVRASVRACVRARVCVCMRSRGWRAPAVHFDDDVTLMMTSRHT